jgi:hypothetical protein
MSEKEKEFLSMIDALQKTDLVQKPNTEKKKKTKKKTSSASNPSQTRKRPSTTRSSKSNVGLYAPHNPDHAIHNIVLEAPQQQQVQMMQHQPNVMQTLIISQESEGPVRKRRKEEEEGFNLTSTTAQGAPNHTTMHSLQLEEEQIKLRLREIEAQLQQQTKLENTSLAPKKTEEKPVQETKTTQSQSQSFSNDLGGHMNSGMPQYGGMGMYGMPLGNMPHFQNGPNLGGAVNQQQVLMPPGMPGMQYPNPAFMYGQYNHPYGMQYGYGQQFAGQFGGYSQVMGQGGGYPYGAPWW